LLKLILSQTYQHDLGQQAIFQRELENHALAKSYEQDHEELLKHLHEVQEENEQLKQAIRQHDQLLPMRQEGRKHHSNTTTSSPEFHEQPCDETTLSTLLEQGEQALSAGKRFYFFSFLAVIQTKNAPPRRHTAFNTASRLSTHFFFSGANV